MEENQIDYAMKVDADSILSLHEWFIFAHSHLPPRGRRIMGGALRHKAYWTSNLPLDEQKHLESYWKEEYDRVHIYLAGQLYFMSYDLCCAIAREAPTAASYMEGFEDHDVSSMAFHSAASKTTTTTTSSTNETSGLRYSGGAIHIIPIAKFQRFWAHPVKGQRRWIRIRKREEARMAGEQFDGKDLLVYRDF